ncbi:MAG: L-threonylcarbamoyladenylate synthase, partial [Actinomycetes bacterium]
ADASQKSAVTKIFAAKGRPSNHPLIVHVASIEGARTWSSLWPQSAELLGTTYWPGPLSVVVNKAPEVLVEITGGHQTVALRVPGHSMAIELLTRFNGGLAAPSANKFGKVSPTTAQHVWDDLGAVVDYILDGGPCQVGIESTIVDCSVDPPVVLRPGGISAEDIHDIVALGLDDVGLSRAPGMLPAHYAPNCEVTLLNDSSEILRLIHLLDESTLRIIDASIDAIGFASSMYAQLRQSDTDGIRQLFVVLPEPMGIGLAIRDRLTKAAQGSKNQSR